jgi:DNA-binding Xre family transcriptional regulator
MQSISIEIIDALKVAMKSRAITYKQVADKVGVSEKTIKRLFRDKDCSISRLNEICNAIGLSVYDLLDFAKRHTEPRAKLSSDQEAFLQQHRLHFYFLFFLTVGYTPEQIQSKYNLSDISIFKYLRDLDRLSFLELGENNSYRLLIEGKILMQLHGPLHEIIKDMHKTFLTHMLDGNNNRASGFDSSFRYMTHENMHEMVRELEGITQKYRKIAHQDEAVMSREQLIPVKWTTMVSHYEVCGIWPLAEHPEVHEKNNIKAFKPVSLVK